MWLVGTDRLGLERSIETIFNPKDAVGDINSQLLPFQILSVVRDFVFKGRAKKQKRRSKGTKTHQQEKTGPRV